MLHFLYLSVGFVLLTKGAGWLVDGGSAIAERLGLSQLMVGLTVIAWGTSLPELIVAVIASLDGHPSLGLGNALGSNIANIGLVLGATSVLLPATLAWKVRRRDRVWLLSSVGALWLTLYFFGDLERTGGVLLLVMFLLYNVSLWRAEKSSEEETRPSGNRVLRKAILLLIMASAFVAVGAHLIVHSASALAMTFKVSDRVIGLSVVAIGTSLPELAAGIASALKGKAGIGIGNVIGSNIFNTLAVLGVAGVLKPIQDAEVIGSVLSLDLPVVLCFSIAAVFLPRWGGASKVKGWLLLSGYVVFLLSTQL